MKTLRIAQFINIMLVALVMGVLWGTWFALSRSIASLSPEVFLSNGTTMIHNLAVPMSMLMPLAVFSSVWVLWLLGWRERKSAAFILAAIGLFGMIGVIVITLSVNVPIDNLIKLWTVQTLPTDWQAIRDRWEVHHTIRTFLSLAALACVTASALASKSEKTP